MKKIVVVGLGYVGLSNALLLSQKNTVVGIDVSIEKILQLTNKQSPIVDPEMQDFLSNKKLNLEFSTDLEKCLENTDYVVISTPTNYDAETRHFDLKSVWSVIECVRAYSPSTWIVIKSTIPIGFVEEARKKFQTEKIFFAPEFLREGFALRDNLYPSRIIVGSKDDAAQDFANLLTEGAIAEEIPTIFTGTAEAEAIKLYSNTYLAMRVAYFNELDTYAHANRLASSEIIEGIGLDPRIGMHYNNPSFGYGGYCLPKDTKQLLANYNDTPQNLISAIVASNETRMKYLAKIINARKPKKLGIFGLAMKHGSDNFRDSAILKLLSFCSIDANDILIHEPSFKLPYFDDIKVEHSLTKFKSACDLILCNRYDEKLSDVREKLFTRDLFNTDI